MAILISMDAAQSLSHEALAVARRDAILSALTDAAEVFLRGSLATWQENVLQVIKNLGNRLGTNRIFLGKHSEVTAEWVKTAVRYEWLRAGDKTRVDVPDYQEIHMQESGFGRWAGVLYPGEIVYGRREDFLEGERGGFLSPNWQTLIVVPVFVEREWWGFIAFEDYPFDGGISLAELDAFRTVAVTFGAAIRRKRMEESLLREQQAVEDKARQIQDLARFPSEDPWPVVRLLVNGQLVYANRASQRLLAKWQVEIGGMVPKKWQKLAAQVLMENKPTAVDEILEEQTFSLLFVPLNQAGYVNVYGHEVTRERELDKLKSEFLALASHQLRSPLTSMRWYSERLLKKREGLQPLQLEMVQVIHDSSVKLSKLVNDLLSLSRIERGKIEPEPALNNLNTVIEEVVTELRGQAEAKQVRVELEADDAVGPFFFDGDLVEQAVMNLVNNAIKYTPSGGKVTVKSFWFDERFAGVEITDTGIGIPADEQSRLFEQFFRAKNAKLYINEGTGLGLSLVKMVVEKSGGRIWFNSAEGEGASFTFILPYRRKAK